MLQEKNIGKLKDPHRCTYHLLYDCNSIIPLRMFQHHLSTLMFRGLDIFALHGDNEKKRQEWSWTQLDAQKILDTLLISNINPWFKTKFWKFLPFLKFAASVVLYEFNEITINTNSTQITFATGKIIIISFGSDYTVYMYLVSWNSCDPNNVCSKSKYSLNCVFKMYYNCWDNTIFTTTTTTFVYNSAFLKMDNIWSMLY